VFAAGDDIDNLYRFTVFPWYKLSDKFTAFARLSYSVDSGRDNRTLNFISPGVYYTPTPWLQVWEGMINRYVSKASAPDQLELRPYGGVKLFVPNDWKINFYNFFRYEYRAIEDRDTHDWEGTHRIRNLLGAEVPLVSRERAWQPNTWYALVNVEPFYRFDEHAIDPVRVTGGIGYVLNRYVHMEFTYAAQFSRVNGGPLEYTENILRLNIKIGLNREQRPGPMPSL
jgi:hypothetical protein